MDGNSKKPNEIIRSIGNSWVSCRSNTHVGRVYYFNTLSGQSVWNLSEVETEKCNDKNPHLNQSDDYPEPTEPPMEPPSSSFKENEQTHDNNSTSKIYNKQIINNTFSRQPYPFPAYIVSSFAPGDSLSLRGDNVWPVLPGQQIFLAPAGSQVIHQAQASNVAYHSYQDPIPIQLPSSPPKHLVSQPPAQHQRRVSASQTVNYKGLLQNEFGGFDLREVLSSRKRSQVQDDIRDNEDQHNTSFEALPHNLDVRSPTNSPISTAATEESYQSDADCDWLEDNMRVRGRQLKLDITNLKNLAAPNSRTERWYIGVDKNILLRHLNLLNVLYSSDEQCLLMVPPEVLGQLEETAAGRARRLAMRAARARAFLLQLLEDGYAILGEQHSETADSDTPRLVQCCLNLMLKKYHVVLLSNDTCSQNYKIKAEVPIFTIKELKKFLATDSTYSKPNTSYSEPLLERPMKITISNDTPNTPENLIVTDEITNNAGSECDTSVNGNIFNPHKLQYKQIHSASTATSTLSYRSANSENQTDDVCRRNLIETIAHRTEANHTTSNTINDKPSQKENDTLSVEIEKRRAKIQLKRKSISKQPLVCNNTDNVVETKQFKWRRKRDLSRSKPKDSNSLPLTNSNVFAKDDKCAQKTNYELQIDHNLQQHETLKSTEATNSHVRRTPAENDATEETVEVSGVISNTVSNVDSERESINLNKLAINTTAKCKDDSASMNVMYEVTDHWTEENISKQPLVCNNTDNIVETKQFKWRRKRNLSSSKPKDSNCLPLTDSNVFAKDDKCTQTTNCALQIDHNLQQHETSKSGEATNSPIRRTPTKNNTTQEHVKVSGVISNTVSNVDSERESINPNKLAINSNAKCKGDSANMNVMFEVTNHWTEENLRMKCDEWISRFVQIMEEVLSQVLYKEPQFFCKQMPPPWSLYEATQCIARKFKRYDKVTDAARKLSEVLFRISNKKGVICKQKVLPSDYMVMYSCGVLLVDSLQTVVRNCEDLKAATLLLSRLLKDIRNPNLDASHNDTFVFEENVEPPAEISFLQDDEPEQHKTTPQKSQQSMTYNERNNLSYNLRTRNREEKPSANQEKTKKVSRKKPNVSKTVDKSSFFNSLNLQKKIATLYGEGTETMDNLVERSVSGDVPNDGTSCSKTPFNSEQNLEKKSLSRTNIRESSENKSPNHSNIAEHSENKSSSHTNIGDNSEKKSKNDPDISDNRDSIQPKILRNFTICSDFEGKLKIKNNISRLPLHLDELNYRNASDFYCKQYFMPEENYASEEIIEAAEAGESRSDQMYENYDWGEHENGDTNGDTDVNGNCLHWYYKQFMSEIKEAFIQSRTFCVKSQEELRKIGHLKSKKYEILQKAEKAVLRINEIMKSLQSILHRETYGSDSNVQSLLIKARFQVEQSTSLRDIVTKCLDQGSDILESINVIIEMVKT